MSLLKELIKFQKNEKISMHIPGHKSGRGLGAYFIKNAFKIDVTELCGTDNLQNPTGIIKKAQDKCADIFGAGETYFLTGGSSLGLRAAVLGCAKRGDKLLVDRTCHKSVISAITLGGIEPVFISPEFDSEKGLYIGISADAVNCAVAENPDICGAVITSPTYYGICSDIGQIAKVLHGFNKFLIVDEAHGTHFKFSKNLPDAAMQLGADICVQSAHKTLPALGQCSYLHMRDGKYINRDRVIKILRMIQTTSPSYMLMSSLEESARDMTFKGKRRLGKVIEEIERLKEIVREETVIDFADEKTLGVAQDRSRIVADFARAEISGRFAESVLIKDFGIYPEMSDERYVVFVPSAYTKKDEIRKLCTALCTIGKFRYKDDTRGENIKLLDISLKHLPCEAIQKESEKVLVNNAVGKVCAEIISVCPPGAAILIPGQRIDKKIVDYIKNYNIAEEIEVVSEQVK